jgi:[acyl-carrier-protein] S-malonyltransferase
MTGRALMFPGQGSQVVGMGKELAATFSEAREVFSEVDETLKQRLSELMFDGPIEDLTDTRNAQPALMAVSVAVVRVLEKQGGMALPELAHYLAGHSLGEYSALCAAGAISLSETATLLRIRGQAMQDAVPKGLGGMVALVGTDIDMAQAIVKEARAAGACQVANDNGGGQVVVSGEMAAMDQVVMLASKYGIKRAVKLPVSAPFHSSLMEPARLVMQEALSKAKISRPSVPVIANVTAEQVIEPSAIRQLLAEQVTGMVRWRESIQELKRKEVVQAVECGAGKVLAGLVKRIEPGIETASLQEPKDIEEFLNTMQQHN